MAPYARKAIVGAGSIESFFRVALALRRHQQQRSTETRGRTTQESSTNVRDFFLSP